ncbi:MAG: ADP-ribosylglycohydrolase family protein [Hyphomonadaceae bacterium]
MKPSLLLTKIAIADARGVCFEYAPRRVIREKNNWSTSYFPHHKHGTGGGRYSDDAHMSCAVAETLLATGPEASARDFAQQFVAAFKRESTPREGYAGRFFDFLKSVKDTDDFLNRIDPNSAKSGAAMRAGPCGVLGSIDKTMEVAARQAAITHNTPDGIAAAQAAALMVHYLAFELGSRLDLPQFLNQHVPVQDWSQPHRGEVGPKGLESVRAALTALLRNASLSDLLIDCVEFGGDVDTVCVIATAAAACADDVNQTIPEPLWDGLENGDFGRDYLIGLDAQFSEFAQKHMALPA